MTARPIPTPLLTAAATLADSRPDLADLADLGLPALIALAVSAA